MTTDLLGSWEHSGGAVTRGAHGDYWYGDCQLGWNINRSPTYFNVPDHTHPSGYRKDVVKNRVTLWRSDNEEPLGIVSPRFKVVQPIDMIRSFQHMADTQGMALQFAGSAEGGRKLWGLADTGRETRVSGTDLVKLYFMFYTACDGTMSTTGVFTTIRAFCLNMLNMVMGQGMERIRIPHSQDFDPIRFQEELAPAYSQWDDFADASQALAERKVTETEAVQFLINLLGDPKLEATDEKQPNIRAMRGILQLYKGEGKGATERSSKGTAFGLVNAVTEYTDYHRRAQTPDSRFSNATFGKGNRIKNEAWTEALKLVA